LGRNVTESGAYQDWQFYSPCPYDKHR
jgi:hypothetical protein